jgi:hypothetical protein
MHKWIQRGLLVCLCALVLEGAFTIPLLLVWFGWPTLSVQDVCSELMKVRYSDETVECKYPYPLFETAEGELAKGTAQDAWGPQPKPLYKRIGYRDLVKWHNERIARQADAAKTVNP